MQRNNLDLQLSVATQIMPGAYGYQSGSHQLTEQVKAMICTVTASVFLSSFLLQDYPESSLLTDALSLIFALAAAFKLRSLSQDKFGARPIAEVADAVRRDHQITNAQRYGLSIFRSEHAVHTAFNKIILDAAFIAASGRAILSCMLKSSNNYATIAALGVLAYSLVDLYKAQLKNQGATTVLVGRVQQTAPRLAWQ